MKRALATLMTFLVGLGGGVVGAYAVRGVDGPAGQSPAFQAPVRVSAPAGADGVADLVERARGSVVNIDTLAQRGNGTDPFEFFFGESLPTPREQFQKGVGSGFVIRADGLIVTNHHVVANADKLTVSFADGRKLSARVVGSDPATDLALVRVEAKGLPTLPLADEKGLRVGQSVVAMGSPLGLSETVTAGILSAINRGIELNARVGFLQTDAAINPGNSGGPLLNLRGEVIGVNSAVAATAQGIGFAIPVSTLKTVLPQLEKSGKVEHAWLGVRVAPLPEDRGALLYTAEHGVLVAGVEANSPAAKAGLKRGDVIAELNGVKLAGPAALVREVAGHRIGDRVTLLVSRAGQEKRMGLTLDKMPEKLLTGPGE